MLNATSAVAAASGIFVQITTPSPATSNQLINANESVATLVVPSFRSIQVKLTITDNAGHTASGTATIQSALGASAGVGSFGPELLVLAALTGAALARRRYALAACRTELFAT